MSVLLAIILGIVQGVSEFLPISSSGHLVVFQHYLVGLLGKISAPLTFDVLLHLATGIATVFYLRSEVICLPDALSSSEQGYRVRRLFALICAATLPAVVAVVLFKEDIEQSFHSLRTAASGFLVTALVLEFAHRHQRRLSGGAEVISSQPLAWQFPTMMQAVIIGCAQVVAICPGVSRSGTTIAAALLLGLSAQSAVRFSFYLLLAAVAGASVLELRKIELSSMQDALAYSVGFFVTLTVAWFSLRILVKVVEEMKLRYFSVYTAGLGLLLHALVLMN